MRSILGCSQQGRVVPPVREPLAVERRLPGCQLCSSLMASINSSGLPLPAHARSLQPVLGSRNRFPHTLPRAAHTPRTPPPYAPSGLKLDTRGSCRVLGWLRSCLVLAWGGESVPAAGGKPTGWEKCPAQAALAGHGCGRATGQPRHPLPVLQKGNNQVRVFPTSTSTTATAPLSLSTAPKNL